MSNATRKASQPSRGGSRSRSTEVNPKSEASLLRQRLKKNASCLHIRNSMIQQFYRDHDLPDFTKQACKNKDGVLDRVTSTRCDLCAAYGSLSLRQPTGRDKSALFKSGPSTELLNLNEFNRKKNPKIPRHIIAIYLNPFLPWIRSKDYFRFPNAVGTSIRLKVPRNQFGEMHHILICAILNAPESDPEKAAKSEPRVLIDLTDATKGQKELFEFYAGALPQKTLMYKKFKKTSDSKGNATAAICAYFWKNERFEFQERMFGVIRAFMRTKFESHGNNYVSTEYSAKYWINRFLLLTGQGKLPKPDSVSR